MTTARQPPSGTATCPNCGGPVRPQIDWICPNSACGAPLFWQRGEHPDESLAGTLRWPANPPEEAGAAAPGGQPPEEPPRQQLQRGTMPTITCWSCHAVNSADRTYCIRCGRRLRRTPATAVLAAFPWLPERYVTSGTLIGGLLATLVLLAGLLSLNALFGDPPAEQPPAVTTPIPGTTPGVVAVATASATSVWNGDARYGARAVLDNNPATAWISARGRPIGESVTLELPSNTLISEIGIANGYQRTGQFPRYGRAARVLVSFDDGSAQEMTLQDRAGMQTFRVTRPMSSPTRSVLIQIMSVRPSRASNVAISTVVLRGTAR